jgi:hypothetical protein
MKTYTGWAVINALKSWGYNPREFEEVVALLVSDPDCISGAEATVCEDHIAYSLELSEKGKKVYYEWCAENGYHPSLRGKMENLLDFDDDDWLSVENTKFDKES